MAYGPGPYGYLPWWPSRQVLLGTGPLVLAIGAGRELLWYIVSLILLVLAVILPPPSFSFRPRKPSFLRMPNTRRQTLLGFRRRQLVEEINNSGSFAMRPCQSYKGSESPCKVGSSVDSCIRCVSKNLQCDLVPFSLTKWRRLQQARTRKAE